MTRRRPRPAPPPRRCCCRNCIADSLEGALKRLARSRLPMSVALPLSLGVIKVCITDLREHSPLLDAIPNDRAHRERKP